MVDEAVVRAVQRYLRALQGLGLPVGFSVLFGSRARGSTDVWSDIDLLVISPQFDDSIVRKDVDLLWRTAARTDNRIEPVPCGQRQWLEDDGSAIIEIARREGMRIDIPG